MNNAPKKFKTVLDEVIHSVWSAQKIDMRLDLLADEATKIAKTATDIGDFYHKGLDENSGIPENYIATFLFPERVKSFLILWRDILFNQQKAELLRLTDEVSSGNLKNLNDASKETVLAAAASFEDFFEKEKSKVESQKGGVVKAISDWKAQENPWKIYREQIEVLETQCRELRAGQEKLKETAAGFATIQNITKSTLSDCLEDLNRWTTGAEDIIHVITEVCENEVPDPTQISTHVEEVSEGITITNRLTMLNDAIELHTSKMPEKVRVPISTEGGMIQYREGNLRSLVREWLESEVTPLMYEVWEMTENSGNSFKLALMNILNRSVLLKTQMKENPGMEMTASELNQPLSSFLKKTSPNKKDLRELQKILTHRLKTSLKLSEAYNAEVSFLTVPLQSTMRQYRIDRNQVMSDFQRWWHDNTKFFRDWLNLIAKEDALSTSEKIVRYVRNNSGIGENNMYRNIFETTGYIGESFWVGRKNELARIEEVIGNWRLGFRGSVVLTGDRFSGKSLFGELVANRFFATKTIHLTPQSVIEFGGKTFKTSYDLKKALAFIKRHTKDSGTLVWLDNLELWQSRDFPLNRNIRALKDSIGGGSTQIFYLVSMTSWLENQLLRFHNLESIFQAKINLDEMGLQEVWEAILIRHGATHKTLIDEKTQQEITSRRFHKLARQVYNSADGNVGDALNLWSNSIEKIDDENVIFRQKESYPFPDFINSENGLLLSTIVVAKRISEADLRKIFGPSYNEKYASTLRQLINIGLLERLQDGKLQIIETAVNRVGRLLKKKKFL